MSMRCWQSGTTYCLVTVFADRRDAAHAWLTRLPAEGAHTPRRQPAPRDALHIRAHLRKRPQMVFPRAAPFAAAIPGNSAVEQVLTTGLSSFL